jgi:hypothetical protein
MSEPPLLPQAAEKPVRAQRIEAPPNPRLARMRFLSKLLDNSIPLPGGYRIGLDPIIGLVPAVGDFFASLLSFWLIFDAARLGLQKRIIARMALNVVIESMAGTIPILGDIFDAAWKANARNMVLVEKHYSPALRGRSARGMAATFLLCLLVFYAGLFTLVYFVFKGIFSLFQ